MDAPDYDLCIIGGGINGAGIARDAAMRGLSVLLVEKGDLASSTSSASTKLIHGGLRYLEHFEFSLVRHSLLERETLLKLAPHIVSPMEFVLPHEPHLRPAWMIRAGLFLYDHLARRDTLPSSKKISLSSSPLKKKYKTGFSYADCWVDDARLVVLNAIDAKNHGAVIKTRTTCKQIVPRDKSWAVHLSGGEPITAKMVVNAAGPWVRKLLEISLLQDGTPNLRLVKGSHIIVPRFTPEAHAYILQQADKRIVFAIPYEEEFTLIGTTDVEYHGDPKDVKIDHQEIDYLCDAVNKSFKTQISPDDIISDYSGVRPLLDDGDDNVSSVTRDYKLILDESKGPKLLSVFGGKLTTYRHLAQEVVDTLTDKKCTTDQKVLPGGDIPNLKNFIAAKTALYKHLPSSLIERYAKSYGTQMEMFAGDEMGEHFGDHLYEAEVRYLIEHEWALSAEDILWRRSKLGLHISKQTAQNLEDYLKRNTKKS